ncbi:MAG: DUF6677 family protein [Planctomycetota bacterium]|jgi:hypothetical protein
MTEADSAKDKSSGSGRSEAKTPRRRKPLLALFLGWLVPGLGHAYAGDFRRGIIFFILMVGGIFLGFVISDGEAIDVTLHDIAFIGQAGAGIPVLGTAGVKYARAHREIRSEYGPGMGFTEIRRHIRKERENRLESEHNERGHINPWTELGLLLVTIAGLLNILIAIDAAVTAVAPPVTAKVRKTEPAVEKKPEHGIVIEESETAPESNTE